MKLVIVGGGSAGWMTAAYLKKFQRSIDISVIESDKIPIIGVGESVTPHVTTFFEDLGIPKKHWMQNTGSIFKYANKFVNWKENKGETEYFSFNYSTQAKNFYKDITPAFSKEDFSNDIKSERNIDYLIKMCLNGDADRFDRYFNPQFHYMEKNTSPFIDSELLLNAPYSYSQHINAELAGKYLKDFVAMPNGVKQIIGTVTDINIQGNKIKTITLNDGKIISGDLFVDCTGFHKILTKKLGWEEKIYDNHLIDSAWVCQTEYTDQENEMVNYTQSIAEPYGWIFKIGLYHRMGNGYCFSSKHISDDDALIHFENRIGVQKNKPRLIKWQPKRLKKFASGNVVAIGLSCGFVEPLEANALYIITSSIRLLNEALTSMNFSKFNETLEYTIDDIADFILVHYTLSSREDTSFWKDMKKIGVLHNHKKLLIDKINHPNNLMTSALKNYTMFPDYMWAQLAVSWDCANLYERNLNDKTYELAKLHFNYSENKHNIIAESMSNNFNWHRENIFDGIEPKLWGTKFLT
jgi:tryptophan halogenase